MFFFAKALIMATAALNPAQEVEEEELALDEETAIIEEQEFEEGEFIFDDQETIAELEDADFAATKKVPTK